MSVSKETPPVIGTVNFAIESIVFENRLLNGAHSISDTKVPWFNFDFVFIKYGNAYAYVFFKNKDHVTMYSYNG